MKEAMIACFVLLALVIAAMLVSSCERRSGTPQAGATPCLRERRMHVYGTYKGFIGGNMTGDLPVDLTVDLTVTECLEWGKPE